MELGVYSFAEMLPDKRGGTPLTAQERLLEIVEEIELADQVGLDIYGLGEHHRGDFAASSPAIVLAAATSRTTHIRLTSAVSVLSSADPVRVFQDFATLDLLSSGRAEIMVGRGAFTESFPLFGYDTADYDDLFEEKLDLLLKIRDSERVTCDGRFRAALKDQAVFPRPVQQPLPVWVAIGGTPKSAARAGTAGLPLAIGIIAGDVRRFAPLADVYRQAWKQADHGLAEQHLAITAHGFVAGSADEAVEATYPAFEAALRNFLNVPPSAVPTRRQYAAEMELSGALVAGSPEEVAEKILFQHKLFGNDRFLMQISVGTLPHAEVLRSIELLGTKVAPVVRAGAGAA